MKKNMRKTICLNMIVKNEAHIIAKTLANILTYIPITYWVIADTGSTDNTIEVIQTFFKERKIKGEILQHTWKDFAHNRTLALQAAYKKTDFIFIFDADDSIHGEFIMPELNHDWYLFEFGNQFKYVRPLLFSNHKKWKYTGVLHEYLEPLDQMSTAITLKGNYFIESGRLGDRSKNPDKYYHDALVLEKAFETETVEKLKHRYAFYCAQSYRDAGEQYIDKSIEWYSKIMDNKQQWDQERYYAALQLGILYHKKNIQDKSLHYFLKTAEFDSERIEGIVLAMQLYSQMGNHILVNALYYKFKDYKLADNKLFIETLSYKHRIEFFNSISAFHVKDNKEGYECCKKTLIGNQLPPPDQELTIQNLMTGYKSFVSEDNSTLELFQSIQPSTWNIHAIGLWNMLYLKNKNYFTQINSHSIPSKIKSSNHSILISFYCKEISEFKQTLNSMIRYCEDLTLIPHWICICEPNVNLDKLKNYTWIEFYKKDQLPINMVWEKINTLKPKYWVNVPNCIFYHPIGLKPLLSILDKNSHSIKQIIFNRNYGTVPNSIQETIPLADMPISLHEYNETATLTDSTYRYWPHFAIQPSVCLVEPILKLGKFSDSPFSEYEYAVRWATNYKTAFTLKNTFYIPNSMARHTMVNTTCEHPHIRVVNLERRLDRKQKLQSIFKSQKIDPKWVVAVDGKQLMPTDEIKKMVEGNMYNSRRGVIGCALSHLNLWKQLVSDPLHEYYIVLEDDIEFFAEDWYSKINSLVGMKSESVDLIWLGYHMFSPVREKVKNIYDIFSTTIELSPFVNHQYIGGTFSYIIYKSGAQKIINYIESSGIKQPIDNLMVGVPDLIMKEIRPFLIKSEWYEDIHKPVDSDIQMINDNLFLDQNLHSLLDQFIFIPNIDQIGLDLYYAPSNNIADLLTRALKDDHCVGFNTLGYFKHAIQQLTPSTVFKEKDGIFLKKSRVKFVKEDSK